jgi:uncharacterized membrane protein
VGEVRLARALGSVGSRVLPGSETTWSRAAHLLALGTLVVGTHELWKRAMHGIESGTSQYDKALDESAPGVWTTPLVSGDPESLVDWSGMGREGRRHVSTFARPEPVKNLPAEIQGVPRPDLSISTVMQEPAKAAPIVIFVGLDNAPTGTERVDAGPRGDGPHRRLVAIADHARLPDGHRLRQLRGNRRRAVPDARRHRDSVTLQYSKRPSPLSLGKVGDARSRTGCCGCASWSGALMAPEDRPKVVLFGESLGAHTSQAAFVGWGTLGPEALGIDRALWIGTPEGSHWRHEIVGPDRPTSTTSLVAVVNDYEQFLRAHTRGTGAHPVLSCSATTTTG